MPYMIKKDGEKFCIYKENEDGSPGEKIKCHDTEQDAKDQMAALYANVSDAQKLILWPVKVAGEWIVEVRGVPFGVDRDNQTFDANTDYMLDQFPTPIITYHHGINPGRDGIQGRPVIIGKTLDVEQRKDGIWLRVLLDKTVEFARRVWEAAQKGLAVASSDSIAHLARLEVNGKQIMYEKDRPGRIAVWPLAGMSLWDAGHGNFMPASPNAIALPSMKAMYREAGLTFPDVTDTGGVPEASAGRARVAKANAAQLAAEKLLKKTRQLVEEK
ncbi:MAG TPA: hypothetical protein PKC99_12690 [Anaerolineales bacterium]|nr:hypothetical protein [Anaerolineales bacterium]